jgi:hypothetical protein
LLILSIVEDLDLQPSEKGNTLRLVAVRLLDPLFRLVRANIHISKKKVLHETTGDFMSLLCMHMYHVPISVLMKMERLKKKYQIITPQSLDRAFHISPDIGEVSHPEISSQMRSLAYALPNRPSAAALAQGSSSPQ